MSAVGWKAISGTLRLQFEREYILLAGLDLSRDFRGLGISVSFGNCKAAGLPRAFLGFPDGDFMEADGGAIAGASRHQREFAFVVGVARADRSLARRKKSNPNIRQRFSLHRDDAFHRRGFGCIACRATEKARQSN
jgi:hypothetical protein